MIHELKTVNPHFTDVLEGRKTFEFRKNDRGFNVNDTLVLREYVPIDHNEQEPSSSNGHKYTGRSIAVRVKHILYEYAGFDPGYVIMSIESNTDKKLSKAIDALVDIADWDGKLAEAWSDPGYRAAHALDGINELPARDGFELI